MTSPKITKAAEIIESASEAYRIKERSILSRYVGGHAAYMSWCAEKIEHKKYFYWNYFGGKNKGSRNLLESETHPLPHLISEEINEIYALVASKNPELVKSGVLGQAISVLVQNSWKDNEFKFDLGNTRPSFFCSGLERKCTIEINGNVEQESLRHSKNVRYILHGSAGKDSIHKLHNCTVFAKRLEGSVDELLNCNINAEEIGQDEYGYSISHATGSFFNVRHLNGGIHGECSIFDVKELEGDIKVYNSIVILRGNKIPQLPNFRGSYRTEGENSKLIIFDKSVYYFWHRMIEDNINNFKINRHTLSFYPPEIILVEGKFSKGDFGEGLGYINGKEKR